MPGHFVVDYALSVGIKQLCLIVLASPPTPTPNFFLFKQTNVYSDIDLLEKDYLIIIA